MDGKFEYNSLEHFGDDVYISKSVEIKRPHLMTVGNHVAIDSYFYCTTSLWIGDYIHIAPFVSVIGGEDGIFLVGNFCTIAAGCRIVVRGDAHMGKGLVSPVIPPMYRDEVVGQNIVMNKFSALGTNAVMLPNTWLAEGVVVGANSLVTKPIEEPWGIYVGSPAKKIKDRPREQMLEFAKALGYDE
jgi:galactoside O-acetyltransferase